MTKITSPLCILFLCLLSLSSFSISAAQTDTAQNRTITLTAYNPDYNFLNNIPVTIGAASGQTTVGVNFPNNYGFHAFIWNGKLYRPCDTSPTGVCIGYWSKNYGGISVGWTLLFDDDETYNPNDPCCSVDGTWGVSTIDGRDYLTNYDTTLFEMCDVDPNGSGTMGYWIGYAVTSERWKCYPGATLAITWDY
ncbi:uncharacterized protein H6S33_000993 [Morchella sextelata]|uniref:uncharacterized protein n=1 Tax=Morchella sextelata TaxID=1174677 RepID=UPI001D043A43|nr:uncharacterized protein H6S33_000993 [Morchella sextelata]KAH0615357.1 hypothetical protein H6S33_000993 [Morchella sextelata]